MEGESIFDFNLAIRVATAALVSGGFVFFVAKYAELRGQLIQAEKELNLTSHGKLATTTLGKKFFSPPSMTRLFLVQVHL